MSEKNLYIPPHLRSGASKPEANNNDVNDDALDLKGLLNHWNPRYIDFKDNKFLQSFRSVECIGSYAYNFTTGEIRDRAQFSWLNKNQIGELEGYDLSKGYEDFHFTDEDRQEQYRKDKSTIFSWLMQQQELTKTGDFVCKRSLLKSVGLKTCSRVLGVKLGNTIFLYDLTKFEWSPDTQLLYYMGNQFAKLLTTPTSTDADKLQQNTDASNYAVFRARLGQPESSFEVLIVAEIDGVDEKGNFIELKTSHVNKPSTTNIMSWWLQSYLVNVKNLYIGIKKDTVIQKIELLDNWKFKPSQYTTAALERIEIFLNQVRTFFDQSDDDEWMLMEKSDDQDDWTSRVLNSSDREEFREFVPKEFYEHIGVNPHGTLWTRFKAQSLRLLNSHSTTTSTNERKTVHSNPIHFNFCPTINFLLKADVREDSADFYVYCDGGIRDDFNCILWVESERESTEHSMAINESVKIQHSGQSLAIHFKIVYNKQCPLCAGNQENEIINFIEDREPQSQRKRKLECSDDPNDSKKLKEELDQQKSEISKLNTQMETLTGELVVAKSECDQLKKKCEELEQTVQKAQDDYQRLQVESNEQISTLKAERDKLTAEPSGHYKETVKCGFEVLKTLFMAITKSDEEMTKLLIEFPIRNSGKEKWGCFLGSIFKFIDQNLNLYKKGCRSVEITESVSVSKDIQIRFLLVKKQT